VHVPQIGIPLSLAFIAVVLVVTTAASLWASRRSRPAA
jgi:tellurite resistance protein TerC